MNLTEAKKSIELIKKYIEKDYFFNNEEIKIKIQNRDFAAKQGQNVSMYTNEVIKRYVLNKSLRLSFYKTVLPIYHAIKNNDVNFLISRIRYDQKFSRDIYFMFTGVHLPNSNKAIYEYFKSK